MNRYGIIGLVIMLALTTSVYASMTLGKAHADFVTCKGNFYDGKYIKVFSIESMTKDQIMTLFKTVDACVGQGYLVKPFDSNYLIVEKSKG